MANFQSDFVLGLQGKLYQDFLDNIAHSIIRNILKTDDYQIIDFDKHLSYLDFDKSKRKNSIFPEFYLNFLNDIQKDKEIGKVSFKKKVCITLDERLCRDICPNTGRKITTIKIGGVDLAYFIYFDVKEFFDFVYGENYKKEEIVKKLDDSNKKDIVDECSNHKKEANKFIEVNSLKDLGGLLQLNNSESNKDKQGEEKSNYHRQIKIGYIHNHNNGHSYIRTSINRKDTFRIPHRLFSEIKDFSIGTVIKAECDIDENNQVRKIYSYSQSSEKELNLSFERIEGKLEREFGKDFAFIKSYDDIDIYVPPSLAKYFGIGEKYNVYCLAVQSLDNNGKLGWEALEVFEITSF